MANEDRQLLQELNDPQREGDVVRVENSGETRIFTLLHIAGSGKTGVVWAARDNVNKRYALKFVSQSDYVQHSLFSEVSQVRTLATPLIAKIEYYGKPSGWDGPAWSKFYAIAVEWIDGITIEEFLKKPNSVSIQTMLRLTRDLCELLKALEAKKLVHGDLKAANIIVRPQEDLLTGENTVRIIAIDSGQLKTVDRRSELINRWRQDLETLMTLSEVTEEIRKRQQILRLRVERASRSDLEYVTSLLCLIANAILDRKSPTRHELIHRTKDLQQCFQHFIDPDPSRQINDPLAVYENIRSVLTKSSDDQFSMTTPFDLPSAELIRSDRQLMELFSSDFPRIDECRSDSPTYIYGPRGCGKSTVLRSLSIKAVLDTQDVNKSFGEVGFIGVYLSCSSELRSRFWLFKEEHFKKLESQIVRYFNLLLLEQLAVSLNAMYEHEQLPNGMRFGLSQDVALQVCETIKAKSELKHESTRYHSVSPFIQLSKQIRMERDSLWKSITNLKYVDKLPDAQLVFDVCQELESLCPIFKTKKIAFLLDDYSNQRIPAELQKRLNQSITFSRQGTPLFKVSSEYYGLDLEGIQEGREVREVNVGREYVSLTDGNRWHFLAQLLEKRFAYKNVNVQLKNILGLQELGVATEMATAIQTAHNEHKRFFYFGVDTISDVCSGDFAMGIDLVRRIFEDSNTKWDTPRLIEPKSQHDTITEYGTREFQYIRYRWVNGNRKFEIIDRLCWLARKCVLERTVKRGSRYTPLVKTHLDIAETAMRDLEQQSPSLYTLLDELIRKGVLFPLDSSAARESQNRTRRYMVRRILLAKHVVPLGRHTAIILDDVEPLKMLLSEPAKFVENEFQVTGSRSKADEQGPVQQDLFDGNY